MVAGRPTVSVDLPSSLSQFAGAEAIWLNERGGLTFRAGDRIVKWNPAGTGIELTDEVVRLDWLRGRLPVPHVIEVGADHSGEWLVTLAIDATSAIEWSGGVAAREMGIGLRRLHDALPVDECPFDWSAESRGGAKPPPIDRLVVCHGDACAPNTLIREERFAATVDLGRLGVADRWADLAVASMSLEWNFGAGLEDAFFAAYGIARSERHIRYYRDLWNSNA